MNFIQRTLSIILGWFVKPASLEEQKAEPEIKKRKQQRPAATACAICKKQINTINGYFCQYCKKWHCSEHKLPEAHKCRSPNNPYISFGK